MASGAGIAQPLGLEGSGSAAWHRAKSAPRPKRCLDLHLRGLFNSTEKFNSTLFVLCSADASAEETTEISFEKEFGPWRPLPICWWEGGQDFSCPHTSKLQTTEMRWGHLGTEGGWLDSGWAVSQWACVTRGSAVL